MKVCFSASLIPLERPQRLRKAANTGRMGRVTVGFMKYPKLVSANSAECQLPTSKVLERPCPRKRVLGLERPPVG